MRPRRLAPHATPLLCIALLVGATPRDVCAETGAPTAEAAEVPAALTPDSLSPELRRLWFEGLELERSERLGESSERYELLAEALPRSPFIRWRLSRNHWRAGERLPVEDKPGRTQEFQTAQTWADRGLAVDANCGECVLWKLAAMGRLATTEGVVQAAGTAADIAELIERGIALRPSHVDNPSNVTLGNLYYAGAAFYRVVPEWFWLEWMIGVRGDKDRALDYIHKALELSESRVDYHVELGAILLCIGYERDQPERLAEGRRVLEGAMNMEHFQTTDAIDLEHARILLAQPERACGYSRDGWIDLGEGARSSRRPH